MAPKKLPGKEAASSKTPRKLKAQNTDRDVQKTRIDTLSMLTDKEFDGTTNERGMTGREVVAERKRLNRIDKEKYPCGKGFYEEVVSEFRSENSPVKKLVAKDGSEVITPALLHAMGKFGTHGNREVVVSYLRLADRCNQKEMVGICKNFALKIKPHSSSDQLRCGLDVLDFFSRVGLKSRFTEEATIMKPWMEEVLCAAHKAAKGENAQPKAFVNNHRGPLSLVLDIAAVDRVFSVNENELTGLEQTVASLVSGSTLGEKIFGSMSIQVLSALVKRDCEAKHAELLGSEQMITNEIIVEAERALMAKFNAMNLPEVLPERRKITVPYRGCETEHNVKCLADEVGVRLWTCIKGAAASAGDIPPIGCENDLVEDSRPGKKNRFHSDVLAKVSKVRADANSLLKKSLLEDAGAIVSLLAKNEADLLATDRWFKIEQAFMTGMRGNAGAKRLQQKVLELLPPHEQTKDLADVIQSVSRLQTSELFKFCGADAQGHVKAVSDILLELVAGEFKGSQNVTESLLVVNSRLQYFANAKSNDGKILIGLDALEYALNTASAKPAAEVALDDVMLLTMYSWLLDEEHRTASENLLAQALKNEGTPHSAAKRASASATSSEPPTKKVCASGPAPSTQKPNKKALSEMETALKMFE